MKRSMLLILASVMAVMMSVSALPAFADDASPNCTQILKNVDKGLSNGNDHQVVGLLNENPACAGQLTKQEMLQIFANPNIFNALDPQLQNIIDYCANRGLC